MLGAVVVAAAASVAMGFVVRLPEGAGAALSLALHGPSLLLALAAGAGLGLAGTIQAADDARGRGHPLLLAVATGAAFGGTAGAGLESLGAGPGLGLGTAPGFAVGAGAGALAFTAAVAAASRLGGAARLVTGVLLLAMLGAGLAAAIGAKGDPTGLRPVTWWLLGDLSRARWATALPLAAGIAVLSGLLARRAAPLPSLDAAPPGVRRGLLGLSGLLLGLCLGAIGLVAFFPLLVALAARWLLGDPPLRPWLVLSAVLGALALVQAHALPHALFGGLAPPLGLGVAALAVPWFLLRAEERSAPWARGLEVLLGLLGLAAVGGAAFVLARLASFIA